MKIVDSSVWIDFFNGIESQETNLLTQLLEREPVGIGDLILTEVLQGFSSDRDYKIAKRYLTALPCFTMGGNEIAIKSADNYRFLRKKGFTIRKTINMIIGTFCIENSYELLHCDKDFEPFSIYLGLKVI